MHLICRWLYFLYLVFIYQVLLKVRNKFLVIRDWFGLTGALKKASVLFILSKINSYLPYILYRGLHPIHSRPVEAESIWP